MTSHIPGTKQISTVLSDAVLAAVSFFCANLLRPYNPLGSLGMLSIGAAASAGVLRFNGVRKAVNIHDKLTFFSTTAGMLFLAFGFLLSPSGYPDLPTASAMAVGASVATYILISRKPRLQEPLGLAFGFSFIGGALYKLILLQLWAGVAGVLIFTAAGLLGTSGNIQGFKKVDVFHYVLAGALFFITQALIQVW